MSQIFDERNKAYSLEMDRRIDAYKAGKTKLISLDEVEKKARAIAQKIKSKKAEYLH